MSEWKITTPIDRFKRPDSGSEIDIVSTVHFGTQRYYDEIGRYVARRQMGGFVVHCEGIGSDDELPQSKNPIHTLKTRLQHAEDYTIRDINDLLSGSRYMSQYEGLPTIPGAKYNDMSEADFIRDTSVVALTKNLISARLFERIAKKGPEAIDDYIFHSLQATVDDAMSGKDRRKVTIQARDEIALEGVDAELADDAAARLVLVWGISHLAGLRAGLEDRGFALTGSKQVEVVADNARMKRAAQRGTVVQPVL